MLKATNKDVIERFGLRLIMRRAWFSHKYEPYFRALPFSEALRCSWASFRNQIDNEREKNARKAKEILEFKGDPNVYSPLNPYKKKKPDLDDPRVNYHIGRFGA